MKCRIILLYHFMINIFTFFDLCCYETIIAYEMSETIDNFVNCKLLIVDAISSLRIKKEYLSSSNIM